MQAILPLALVVLAAVSRVFSFDLSRNDNLALYWGQDGSGNQKDLAFYCQSSSADIFPIAFLYEFFSTGDLPKVDFANSCGSTTFGGSALLECDSIGDDIKTCQDAGKAVTLSLGGATGVVGFTSDSEAEEFADTVWNVFLGGSSDTRPFGDAILDGVDLDIESGTAAHYAAFVNRLRTHTDSADKTYYVTAAPQCPYPDAYIGDALNDASFDAVYVQFYNNYCGLDEPSDYNMATWDNWAKTKSANKDVKVYIGAPGSSSSAGSGYVSASKLAEFAQEAQEKYTSFGGVMMWDASTAYENSRYDKSVKSAMSSGGSASSASSSAASSTTKTASETATTSKKSTKTKSSSATESTGNAFSSDIASITSKIKTFNAVTTTASSSVSTSSSVSATVTSSSAAATATSIDDDSDCEDDEPTDDDSDCEDDDSTGSDDDSDCEDDDDTTTASATTTSSSSSASASATASDDDDCTDDAPTSTAATSTATATSFKMRRVHRRTMHHH